MFFSPTLLSLSTPHHQNTLSILCLSSGDSDGLGHIRKLELLESAKTLGIDDEHAVTVIESPELPDSMEKRWNASVIADVMSELEMARKAEVVLTFDEGGVSGHPNHVSLLDGAREFVGRVRERERREVGVWKLRTVGLVRKYGGVLDAALTWFLVGDKGGKRDGGMGEGRAVFVSDWKGVRTAQKAMTEAHKSQMRWFRWGWIGLSRYMVVNEVREDGGWGGEEFIP